MPPLMMWTVASPPGGATPIMPITRTGMLTSVGGSAEHRCCRAVWQGKVISRNMAFRACCSVLLAAKAAASSEGEVIERHLPRRLRRSVGGSFSDGGDLHVRRLRQTRRLPSDRSLHAERWPARLSVAAGHPHRTRRRAGTGPWLADQDRSPVARRLLDPDRPPVPYEFLRPEPDTELPEDIAMAGGFLALFVSGASAYSLDMPRRWTAPPPWRPGRRSRTSLMD